jgi:asparagine synthase (glutamine-hydrolysing)
MCGLIAAFSRSEFPAEAAQRALSRMHARGPDGQGEWRALGVYLGHRRLAILDLEPRAGQPMQSACERYVMVFNGEIYNYRELRRDLEARGVHFRTASDTEVVLALFAAEGEGLLAQLRGMFAMVIWDRQTRRAFVARDPYGIKPLYVGHFPDGVVLASQVKAIMATGLIDDAGDPEGQAGFWMLGSIPEPHTWYRNVQAIPAGNCGWIEDSRLVSQRCWADIGAVWREAALLPPDNRPLNEVQQDVSQALRETVDRHLVSDVPVGVFLSGGIDSGALAGLMVEAGASDLQGVTIAYEEFAGRPEDEAPVAAVIARHYGIRHHVRRVTRDEFLHDVPRIMEAMDQPSIDGVNTWYASKAVAELGLKVVVSGVGGDELFLGYESFRSLPRMVSTWRLLARVPGMMTLTRSFANFQARRSGNSRWRHAPEWAQTMAGAWWLKRSVHAPEALDGLMEEHLLDEGLRDFDAEAWVGRMTGPLPENETLALAQIESMTYLRNQLLRDSDWASMDHSVELRTPLVDAHLLRALQPLLPRFAEFPNKTLLANAPQKALPKVILERSKTGFAIPVQRWLRESAWGEPGDLGWRGWMRAMVAAYESL